MHAFDLEVLAVSIYAVNVATLKIVHYENMPIQIYSKHLLQKLKLFR